VDSGWEGNHQTGNTARVWSTESGQMVFVVRADAPVVALALSPDGARLIASAANGAIYAVDTGERPHH